MSKGVIIFGASINSFKISKYHAELSDKIIDVTKIDDGGYVSITEGMEEANDAVLNETIQNHRIKIQRSFPELSNIVVSGVVVFIPDDAKEFTLSILTRKIGQYSPEVIVRMENFHYGHRRLDKDSFKADEQMINRAMKEKYPDLPDNSHRLRKAYFKL
jgi:hypothetical protein